jgi:xanthine dehydrogenase YagS FAD-binding subunit
MKSFEYAAPKSLKEATALLSEQWDETEIMAGGTDLITSLKQEIISPKRVVSLKKISDLRGIKSERNALRIGSMTSLSELIADKSVQRNFPSLVTAVQNIASPQMLTMGTVGGDLCQRPRCWYFRNGHGLLGGRDVAVSLQFLEEQRRRVQVGLLTPLDEKLAQAELQHAQSLVRNGDNRYHAIFGTHEQALFVSASSLGPALVALDAALTAEGPKGKTRQIAAKDFFRAPKSENERETALKPNEVLTEISIPVKGLKNATYEVRHRYGLDWPYVTATVAFAEKNGSVSDSRVVLGHVAATPWFAASAAKALNGARLDESAASKCADAAVEGAKPLSKNEYKVQLVRAAVKRAVLATRAA